MRFYKLFLLIAFPFISFGQIFPAGEPDPEEKPVELEKPRAEWKDRIHYGGNIWLAFWGSLYVEATPMVGIDLTDKGTVGGVGATLQYFGADRSYGGGFSVGPRVFVRQAIWKSFFAHAEYEMMYSNSQNFYNTQKQLTPGEKPGYRWGGTGYVGAGFYQNGFRGQGGGYLSVLYNLSAPNSGYINRQSLGDGRFVLRVGVFI